MSRRSVAALAVRSASLVSTAMQRLRRPPVRALILLYHRIADLEVDPWGLAVTPEHFADQIAVLAGIAHPVRLDELASSRAQLRTRRPLVAVTFDDGYADNLHAALPILERYDVPATFFVTAGPV